MDGISVQLCAMYTINTKALFTQKTSDTYQEQPWYNLCHKSEVVELDASNICRWRNCVSVQRKRRYIKLNRIWSLYVKGANIYI